MFVDCPRCSGAGRIEAPEWAARAWDAFVEVPTLDGWVCAVDVQRVVGWSHGTVVRRLEILERGGRVRSRVRGGRREWCRVEFRQGLTCDEDGIPVMGPQQVDGAPSSAATVMAQHPDLELRRASELEDGLSGAPESDVPEEARVVSDVEQYDPRAEAKRGGRR